ncbi:MAG: hypothetical protein HOV82_00935 [Streptomyces sp.]|nr:hypothetical protein [Streptomyces sp.]NUR66953.1 hypothetical protein [Streptomyces sp.]NUS75927.1 hypothetical protein [Streptomyces sp.]
MTRKPQIRYAEDHVVTSHGADFVGQDRHTLKSLIALAPWASNSFSWNDRQAVAPLVQALEAPSARTFTPAEAAVLAEQLLKVSRHRDLKPRPSALARALADAAARAAADGEPWEWIVEAA